MRKQTHIVKLSGAERAQLEELTRKGKFGTLPGARENSAARR